MVEIRTTEVFARWLSRLRDPQGKAAVLRRITRMEKGNPGDTKSVGGGVREIRIPTGPGYRVYYIERGKTVVVLLCAGDKSSQSRDIERAQELAEEVYL
ncbi:MAG: type II toxin-antitoxin system RelE/ParE family toxin [Spiribacter salinus]|uniref:Type II toxin-antitoxin system RelE/ParE family toxin n=1 Tax=Spiribacter salinus TaxID=1335746 RepID=A0A540VEB2_9GAMM|nr:MAG: type II toxin-antitoxin system RelE/ParE family toxin [Spiribacter salinus]